MSAHTVVIAGGGTGGHIFPGLATARALRALRPELEVTWLGGRRGQEARIVPQHGVPIRFVPAARIIGGTLWERLRGGATLAAGLARAGQFLAGTHPAAVLGVGGYASAAGGVAARILRIPLVLQEQNARPGRTNRTLGRFAFRIAVAFDEARAYFPEGRSVLTGNPVRGDIARTPALALAGDEQRHVFVLGGSQGARFLNENVPGLLAAVAERGTPLTVTHQSGAAERDATAARYATAGIDAEVVPFIEDMATAYARASLLVCRAGASTVAELGVAGRPALLVPFPFAADDHQAANAQALVTAGAARMARQETWDEDTLADTVSDMLRADTLRTMAGRAASLGRPDAARRVAELVLEAAGLSPTPGTGEAS